MREADRLEVSLSCGLGPVDAVTRSLDASTHAWVGYYDARPVCVFGVAPLSVLGGIGSPWLLGTDELVRRPRQFLSRCRPYVAEMLSVYPLLVNHVHEGNAASKRWLSWLGFKLEAPAPYGVAGAMFHRFTLEVPNV